MMHVQDFVDDEGLDTAALQTAVEQVQDETDGFRTVKDTFESGGGNLNGLPVSVKDQICTKDMPTTAGSKMLAGYEPPFDATVVRRLREQGATVIGKTNMDEFGFGTFCTNSAFEVPKNPHDTERVVGGSSGGAGAVTAAMTHPHIALAESTGGSISAPAAFCGVVGVTPTYGRVSRYGLIDYANSLDKIGVMAKSVYGAALGLDTIAGNDPRDQTSVEREHAFVDALDEGVDGLTIGVPTQYVDYEGVDPGVREAFWDAVGVMEEHGATYTTIDAERLEKRFSLPAYYIIAMCEASTNLARYSGMRYGAEDDPETESFNDYFKAIRSSHFGDEVKRRILLGTFARMAGYRSQYYEKALRVRRLVIDTFKEAFNEVDLLASPSMPITAPTFKEADSLRPVEVYAMDTLTVGPNLAGVPHASVPTGFVDGMPVGMHLIGDHFQEQTVLNAAQGYEQAAGHDMEP